MTEATVARRGDRALLFAAAISSLFGFVFLVHTPPTWGAFLLHQVEGLVFLGALVLMRRRSDRFRTGVMSVAVFVSTWLVIPATFLAHDDPLRLLPLLPLLATLLLPDEPIVIATASVATFLGLGVMFRLSAVAVRVPYALACSAVIGFACVYGSIRLRTLQRALHEQTEAALSRATRGLAGAAVRLYACRTEESVLEAATAALVSEGLEASFTRGEEAPPQPKGGALRMPVVVEGRTFGILSVSAQGLRAPSAALVQLFASHIGAALENVHHHQESAERLDELERLQAALVARERLAALGEAAAVVAHEVRNPLGAIVNATALLRKVGDPAQTAALLSLLEEEATALDKLVRDLLVLARPITPEKRSVDLVELVARASALLPPQADIRLEAGAGPRKALGDPDYLLLALINLLRNAQQASPPSAHVTVRLRSEGGQQVVTVEDEGPGIPPELRERIFEPFFTTRSAGTGLGLAIVRRVTESHQGTLRVLPHLPRGTRFELLLPAAE